MRTRRVQLLLSVCGCLLLGGCGDQGPPTGEAPTAEQQSSASKNLILGFVKDARTNPQNAANGVVGLVESLEASKETLGPKADEVIASAKKLQSLYSAAGSKSEIEAELDKLETLANSM